MEPTRRTLLAGLTLALTPLPASAQENPRFRAFLESLRSLATAQGVSGATFDQAISGLTPDPVLMGTGVRQAEFERTI